jgi:predicted alpha/beta hydrolase
MPCNIDAKGKAARLIFGIVMVLLGALLIVLTISGTLAGWWPWVVAAGLLGMGGLSIYEGWCGWCIMRAFGFKTPM